MGSCIKKILHYKDKVWRANMNRSIDYWVQSQGREDPLEKKTAIHSSIPAGIIPWTEKPSGLQFMGSQKLGHN